MKKEITARQAGFFLVIMNLAGKLLLMPSMVADNLQSEGLWSIVFLFCIESLVLAFMIAFCKRNPDLTLYDYLKGKLGKILTKILFAVIGLFYLVFIIWIFEETSNFLTDLVYESFDFMAFLIIFLTSAFFMAAKGLKALARTFEIFVLPILLGIVLTLILSLFSDSFNSILPLWNKGIPGIASTSFRVCYLFSEVIGFVMFFGRVKIDKGESKVIWIYYIISMILVILIFLSYISIYKYIYPIQTKAITDIVKFVPNVNEIGKIDIFAIFTMIFISVLYAAFSVWVFLECSYRVYDFKNKFIYNGITLIGLFLLIYYVFYNIDIILSFLNNYMSYFTIVLSLILIILLCFGFGKRKLQYEKNN